MLWGGSALLEDIDHWGGFEGFTGLLHFNFFPLFHAYSWSLVLSSSTMMNSYPFGTISPYKLYISCLSLWYFYHCNRNITHLRWDHLTSTRLSSMMAHACNPNTKEAGAGRPSSWLVWAMEQNLASQNKMKQTQWISVFQGGAFK
jgi:hypothetical protein